MKALISTILYDTHSTAVEMGLNAKGHEAVLLHGADFPARQQGSIAISENGSCEWSLSGPAVDLENSPFDVVWYRRFSEPVLPENIHSGDRRIAQRSCNVFVRALWEMLAPDAFWVNPLAAKERANLKPIQLLEATRAGLKIPPTLCSNDARRIRDFLSEHKDNAIYKPYLPAVWRANGEQYQLLTSEIAVEDLPADEVLRLTSGIFQKRISKSHELRVTYMGDFYLAAKIFATDGPMPKLDWREDYDAIRIEPLKSLPNELDRACKVLMRRLGVVFGCFDFIVTPDGEFVFLEINEMGQFLWLEEIDPDILLFDAFCEFLVSKTRNFRWVRRRDSLRFGDFLNKALVQQNSVDAEIHERRPLNHLADDVDAAPRKVLPSAGEDLP